MELLCERDFITIWYDPRHFIKVEWHGYYSPDRIKEGCSLLLDCFIEKKCSRGLNDARQGQGTFLQAINWLREHFFPQLVEVGVEKVAFILSRDPASRQSLERTLELNDQYEAQVFEDYQMAENWLLGKLDTRAPAPTVSDDRLVFREKEKFIFRNFSDIMYIYSFEKGAALQCVDDTHFTKVSLKELLTQLPKNFVQIHRSYIVNTDYLMSMKHHNSGSYHLFLKELPKVRIPVSKKNVPMLKKLLQV